MCIRDSLNWMTKKNTQICAIVLYIFTSWFCFLLLSFFIWFLSLYCSELNITSLCAMLDVGYPGIATQDERCAQSAAAAAAAVTRKRANTNRQGLPQKIEEERKGRNSSIKMVFISTDLFSFFFVKVGLKTGQNNGPFIWSWVPSTKYPVSDRPGTAA